MPVVITGNNTPTAGGVTYGDGTTYATTSAGTSGQLLQSNGASAPSWVAAPTTSPAGSTGQVQYNNAGAFGAVSSGTSGQVLTSAGAGAAPTWTTPSAGALVLISTTTASGSANTFDITTGFSSTYDDYLIIGENIRLGVTGSDYMAFRMYTGGSVRTSSYQYNSLSILTAPSVSRSTSDSSVPMVAQVYGSTSVISFNIFLRNANSASSRIQGQLSVACTDDSNPDGNNQNNTMFGNTATTSALSGIRLYWPGNASSTFSSGTLRLYGIAKS